MNDPTSSRRKAIIVWCAIAGALALFAMVATVMGPDFRPDHQGIGPIAWISAGVAAFLVAASRIFPRRVKIQDAVPDSAAATRTIIATALCEGSGIFGCIAWMLTGDPWALVAMIIASAGLLLAFPTSSRWHALCVEGPHETPPRYPCTQGRSDGRARRPWAVLILLFLLAIAIVASLILKLPESLYPNFIHGVVMDSAINPGGGIWILTDDSTRFYGTIKTSHGTSSGLHRLLCKANLYLYHPERKTVTRKIVTYLRECPWEFKLVKDGDRLWQVLRMENNDVMIRIFDLKSGKLLLDTDEFIAGLSELKRGIATIRYREDRNLFQVETKDGRKFLYLLEDDSLIPDTYDSLDRKITDSFRDGGVKTVFAFVGESLLSPRQMLYKVRGRTSDLYKERLLFHAGPDSLYVGGYPEIIWNSGDWPPRTSI
jgi:hypothetical protein